VKILGLIVVVLILAGLGWYFYSAQYQAASTIIPPPRPLPTPAPAPSSGASETVIEMSASGFSPAEVTIKAGDTVKFVNKDTKNHRPASGVHPAHQLCPGFDSLEAVEPGESYSFTFNEKKECPMHDHLNPTLRGKIIVQ